MGGLQAPQDQRCRSRAITKSAACERSAGSTAWIAACWRRGVAAAVALVAIPHPTDTVERMRATSPRPPRGYACTFAALKACCMLAVHAQPAWSLACVAHGSNRTVSS